MGGTAEVVIRSARPDDAARLAELLDLGAVPGQPRPAEDAARVRAALEALDRQPGAVLVAERHGEVVGMCQLILMRHLQHGGGWCGEIESMHVHPDERGRGIGAVLLDAAVDQARAAGCYRVQLTSNAARRDAHRFYRAHRFADTHLGFKRDLS